jgi:hypothetical protein
LPPHIEEHVAQEILGDSFIADEAQKPAVDGGAMPGKQRLHRQPIPTGNACNQHLIGGGFAGRSGRRSGSDPLAGECDRH